MAHSRTGIFLEDFLEEASSLPRELQRTLATIRELDERSQSLQAQVQSLVRSCMELLPPKQVSGPSSSTSKLESLRDEIMEKDDQIVALCTEKELLAQQAYELLDGYDVKLAETLDQFQKDLEKDGKMPLDDSPLDMGYLQQRPGSSFWTPNLSQQPESRRPEPRSEPLRQGRDERAPALESRSLVQEFALSQRESDARLAPRDKEKDARLMPPPGKRARNQVPGRSVPGGSTGLERRLNLCVCGQGWSDGMRKCGNETCPNGSWFHPSCVDLGSEVKPEESATWLCPLCQMQTNIVK